jgi:hypothetical protein
MKKVPPYLRDGQYRSWEIEMAARFPLALSEMRWPSVPLVGEKRFVRGRRWSASRAS